MPGEKPDPARHAFLRLSAGALALVAARGALAQFHGRGARGERSGRGGAEGRQPSAEDRLHEALREFDDDLALTNEQQPAWDRYARALRQYVQDAARERARVKSLAGMPLSERIGHQVDVARDRYAAMEDIAAAATALYAALNPEQQTRANPRLAGIVELVAGDVPAATPAREKHERADGAPQYGQP
ncbi:MAG TPA: Spy/CpxP family protein refolding chaperone [Burkholderiales bacterium]|nr:Spy/CpxP family protein refolding chaperone [Burkholderiales bacterium]